MTPAVTAPQRPLIQHCHGTVDPCALQANANAGASLHAHARPRVATDTVYPITVATLLGWEKNGR
jgi:hypothetical protein